MESLFNIVATLVERDSNIGAKCLPTPPHTFLLSDDFQSQTLKRRGSEKK